MTTNMPKKKSTRAKPTKRATKPRARATKQVELAGSRPEAIPELDLVLDKLQDANAEFADAARQINAYQTQALELMHRHSIDTYRGPDLVASLKTTEAKESVKVKRVDPVDAAAEAAE